MEKVLCNARQGCEDSVDRCLLTGHICELEVGNTCTEYEPDGGEEAEEQIIFAS